MVKTLGVLLIFGSCGCFGILKAMEYGRYCRLIQELLLALELLEMEIQYSQNPLVVAFGAVGQRLTSQGAGRLFLEAEDYLQHHPQEMPAVGWQVGVGALQEQIPVSVGLAEYLRNFGQSLGLSDRQSQTKLFSLLRQQLQQCLKEALSKKEQEGRLWQYLGFSAGAGLIILLI